MTEKDKLDAPYMPSVLLADIRKRKNGHWGWSNKKAIDKIYERDRFIRAESADQARKEAAERVAYAWREHGEDITLRIIHAAILSTVNESFTVAPVSNDAEKLAIAVKALESASISLALYDGDYGTLSLVRQALKEIQG